MTSHDRNRRNWERYFSLQSINGQFMLHVICSRTICQSTCSLTTIKFIYSCFKSNLRQLSLLGKHFVRLEIGRHFGSDRVRIDIDRPNVVQLSPAEKKQHLISGFRFSILGVPFMTISDTNSKYLNPYVSFLSIWFNNLAKCDFSSLYLLHLESSSVH